MQLTKHTDISLRVMMHLALISGEKVTIKEVSEIYRLSKHHLMKVVNKLAALGFITSAQGRGGGISSAKPPSEITVGAIVRAMEPSLNLIDCEANDCPIINVCSLSNILADASEIFLKYLDSYTIEDLIHNRIQILDLLSVTDAS